MKKKVDTLQIKKTGTKKKRIVWDLELQKTKKRRNNQAKMMENKKSPIFSALLLLQLTVLRESQATKKKGNLEMTKKRNHQAKMMENKKSPIFSALKTSSLLLLQLTVLRESQATKKKGNLEMTKKRNLEMRMKRNLRNPQKKNLGKKLHSYLRHCLPCCRDLLFVTSQALIILLFPWKAIFAMKIWKVYNKMMSIPLLLKQP